MSIPHTQSSVSSLQDKDQVFDFAPEDKLSISPDNTLVEILMHLGNIKDVSHARLVNRHISHLINNNDIIWKDLFIRSFGEEESQKYTNRQFKNAFKDLYLIIKKLIESLPGGDLLIEANSTDNISPKLFGLVSLSSFNEFLNTIPIKNFETLFDNAFQNDNILLLKIVSQHPRFKDINISSIDPVFSTDTLKRNFARSELILPYLSEQQLKDEFEKCVTWGRANVIEIMNNMSQVFTKIQIADVGGLGWALKRFAERVSSEHLKIVETIKNHSRFSEIPLEGHYGLQDILRNSSPPALKILQQGSQG
jgi:hypothetical protein